MCDNIDDLLPLLSDSNRIRKGSLRAYLRVAAATRTLSGRDRVDGKLPAPSEATRSALLKLVSSCASAFMRSPILAAMDFGRLGKEV